MWVIFKLEDWWFFAQIRLALIKQTRRDNLFDSSLGFTTPRGERSRFFRNLHRLKRNLKIASATSGQRINLIRQLVCPPAQFPVPRCRYGGCCGTCGWWVRFWTCCLWFYCLLFYPLLYYWRKFSFLFQSLSHFFSVCLFTNLELRRKKWSPTGWL